MRDLWRPGGGPSRLTMRRLMVLVDGLPAESATRTAMREALDPQELAEAVARATPGHGPWSHGDYLLAALADRLDALLYVTLRVAGAKSVRPPAPMARPGLLPAGRTRPVLSDAERARFAQVRAQLAAAKAAAKIV